MYEYYGLKACVNGSFGGTYTHISLANVTRKGKEIAQIFVVSYGCYLALIHIYT